MALPDLRHFTPTTISSDPVEALVGEAWVPAIYTSNGWTTADGDKLSADITEWRTPCLNTPVPPNPRSQRPKRKVAKSEG
jgi:hypothetical protein